MRHALLILAALLLPVPSACGADLTFFMKNVAPRAVVVEFSSAAKGTRWPGNDQVYLLEKGEKKSVTISCEEGDSICYGAWVNGDDTIVWGVGPDNDRFCETCCRICAHEKTEPIVIGE
ncbi:MAG: hypothetical protein J0H34_17090 [Rhizobiales bacterium]|nr:hypothetical protein [Hyphomicrobiales bacterium]